MALRANVARGASMIALGLVISTIGCQEEKKPAAPIADAGADAQTGPVVGGKLGEALAAAAQAPPPAQSAGPKDAAGGPPESGIFEPAAADAAFSPTATPKLEIFGDGSDPKVPLSYAFAGGDERKTTLLLQVRAAQQGLPPLIVELVFKADKAKDDKKKTDKAAEPAPAGQPVVVKIAAVKAIRGDVPAELKNLKDSVIRYRLGPSGIATDLAIEYPKDSTPGIELVTGSLVDAVLASTVPLPDKPVGVGAYWMVTDRARSSGVDVLRYRVAKVEKLDGKRATLSLEVRQYAANATLGLPGLPKDVPVSLERYESRGKGEIEVGDTRFMPERGQIALVMQSLLKSPNQPAGQQLVIQTETKAALGAAP
ncbi:hypothetical protein [Polyangium sorediatum]|uniref:Lipoprotein n=1 Tax=Polyangium sorediatum TaxID=889274 RepID=A0ABT6NV80_9BACT|nr:hypothetical protein [Polyangium sorediatum]MDI1432218.1 hypothetical protein [Polyangium sorediatum]